jgi:hypothetical protein
MDVPDNGRAMGFGSRISPRLQEALGPFVVNRYCYIFPSPHLRDTLLNPQALQNDADLFTRGEPSAGSFLDLPYYSLGFCRLSDPFRARRPIMEMKLSPDQIP